MRKRQTLLLFSGFFVMGLCTLPGLGQTDDTAMKMSWDLFRAVETGQQQRAVGDEVPEVRAVLLARSSVTSADLADLRELGYDVLAAFGRFVLVSAPADRFADQESGLAALHFVLNAALPPELLESSTSPGTSGATTIGVPEVWDLGYRGAGAVIAVIDSGFDPQSTALASVCPTYWNITSLPMTVGGYEAVEGQVAQNSAHGTSCAIIASDVAPDAEFHLISSPQSMQPLGWLFALDYAVNVLEADVVTISIETTGCYCHNDGTGPINDLVASILDGSDAAFVVASGNWAGGTGSDRWHYTGTFSDADGDGHHDFTPGATDAWDRNTLRFYARGGERITVFVEWDDWDAEVHYEDLDLYILDETYGIPVGESRAPQYGGTGNPAESIPGGWLPFTIPLTGYYCVRVTNRAVTEHDAAMDPIEFSLFAINADGPFGYVEHSTQCGSVREVATHPLAITVGAVSFDTLELRSYSSRGPTNGGVVKPDLCAPDGVRGTAYSVFYGSSAAAPYVAGAIALLRSVDSNLSPEQAVTILQETATVTTDSCGNTVSAIDVYQAIQAVLEGNE